MQWACYKKALVYGSRVGWTPARRNSNNNINGLSFLTRLVDRKWIQHVENLLQLSPYRFRFGEPDWNWSNFKEKKTDEWETESICDLCECEYNVLKTWFVLSVIWRDDFCRLRVWTELYIASGFSCLTWDFFWVTQLDLHSSRLCVFTETESRSEDFKCSLFHLHFGVTTSFIS